MRQPGDGAPWGDRGAADERATSAGPDASDAGAAASRPAAPGTEHDPGRTGPAPASDAGGTGEQEHRWDPRAGQDRRRGEDRRRGDARRRGEHEARGRSGLLAVLRETVLVVGTALGLSLLIKTFLVQAFYIPSPSMQETLEDGDRVLVSLLTPGPFDLERGDVVVFSDPGGWLDAQPVVERGPVADAMVSALTFVGVLPRNSGEHLIKRVVGLPGDTVACCDPEGRVTVNGVAVQEDYVYPGNDPSDITFEIVVPEGRLWVMGDHRELSLDSRWHQDLEGRGTVPVADVVGRAVAVVWPVGRLDWLQSETEAFAGVPDGAPDGG